MYQNLDITKKSVAVFNALFMLRRIAVAASTTSLDSLLITNIYVNNFTSLLLIKFYLDTKPMVDRPSNTLLILNECFVLLSFYAMFLFNDFIPDIEVRYKLGFKSIYLFISVVVVNIGSLVMQMGQFLRIKYLKRNHKV